MSISQEQVGQIVHQMMEADLEQLLAINEICVQQAKERRKSRIRKVKSKLSEGTEVTVSGGIVDGEKGIVVNVKRTRADVIIDGKEWDVPILNLDPESDNLKDPETSEIQFNNED